MARTNIVWAKNMVPGMNYVFIQDIYLSIAKKKKIYETIYWLLLITYSCFNTFQFSAHFTCNQLFITAYIFHFLCLQVHRMLMSLTVLLTAVGFIFPFIYRGKWSTVSKACALCLDNVLQHTIFSVLNATVTLFALFHLKSVL